MTPRYWLTPGPNGSSGLYVNGSGWTVGYALSKRGRSACLGSSAYCKCGRRFESKSGHGAKTGLGNHRRACRG